APPRSRCPGRGMSERHGSRSHRGSPPGADETAGHCLCAKTADPVRWPVTAPALPSTPPVAPAPGPTPGSQGDVPVLAARVMGPLPLQHAQGTDDPRPCLGRLDDVVD